ncbi:hypothetical protein EV426DRAFT_615770 [Tirmania nivea]|nr:hypothetical protein EV426DRAFT_615770 [Tirmania nivea]
MRLFWQITSVGMRLWGYGILSPFTLYPCQVHATWFIFFHKSSTKRQEVLYLTLFSESCGFKYLNTEWFISRSICMV